MKIDGKTLSPYADVSRLFSNMRTLSVKVGNKTYSGPMDVSLDEQGNLTIDTLQKAPRVSSKAAA